MTRRREPVAPLEPAAAVEPEAVGLSVVIPAYNEAARIGPALDELLAFAGTAPPGDLPDDIEVLVVDDGSTDATATLVRDRAERPVPGSRRVALRLLSLPHGGKGAAVRAGMLAAVGERIVFTDADMATPPDQLPRLLAALASADVALGSRIQTDGRDLRATQPPLRRALGRLFRALASTWVTGPVRDTQCGFKGFRRAAARDVFARQRIRSIVFDVELIHLARRRGWTLTEVPVAWSDRRGSRLRPGLRLALRVAWDLLRIPLLHGDDPPAGQGARLRLPTPLALGGGLLLPAVAFGLWRIAGDKMGYDFDAYRDAALRLLGGQPLYDPAAQVVGPGGLFLYPPPVAVALVPLALVPEPIATFLWGCLMVAAVLLAIWLLPVPGRAREAILLLAAVHWPVQQALKLGQIEPLVLLLLVLAWRDLRRPGRLGLLVGIGTVIKLRPALLLGWALLARRPRAAAAGVATILGIAAAATLASGWGAWTDYVALLLRVGDATTTPYAATAGAAAYQLGAPLESARLVQLAYLASVALLLVAVLRRGDDERGFVAAVVASQAAAPVIWDHSAAVLIIPVAFLLARGAWWALALLAVTPILWVGGIPVWLYPTLLLAALGALLAVGGGRGESVPEPVLSSPA